MSVHDLLNNKMDVMFWEMWELNSPLVRNTAAQNPTFWVDDIERVGRNLETGIENCLITNNHFLGNSHLEWGFDTIYGRG